MNNSTKDIIKPLNRHILCWLVSGVLISSLLYIYVNPYLTPETGVKIVVGSKLIYSISLFVAGIFLINIPCLLSQIDRRVILLLSWYLLFALTTLFNFKTTYSLKNFFQLCIVGFASLVMYLAGKYIAQSNLTFHHFQKIMNISLGILIPLMFIKLYIDAPGNLIYALSFHRPYTIGSYIYPFLLLWINRFSELSFIKRLILNMALILLVILSGSRAIWIWMVIFICCFFWSSRRKFVPILIFSTWTIFYFGQQHIFDFVINRLRIPVRYSIFERGFNFLATGRPQIWRFYFDKIVNSNVPQLIWGFGDKAVIASENGFSFALAHNTLLHLQTLTGIAGLILGLLFLLSIFKKILRKKDVMIIGFILPIFILMWITDLPFFYNGYSRIFENVYFCFFSGLLCSKNVFHLSNINNKGSEIR